MNSPPSLETGATRAARSTTSVDPGRDRLLEFRREVLTLYLRITVFAAVVILPTYYLIGINELTLATLGFFAGVVVLYCAFCRGLVDVAAAARLFLAATIAVCMLGLYLGDESFDNKPWQIVLLVAVFSLVDAREGLAWAGACLAGIVAIAWARVGAYEPLSVMVLLSAEVTAVAALYFFALRHEDNLRTIAHISHTDSLTQTYNRQLFDDLARNAFNRSRRGEEPLALYMIDIDFFKRFNDHYGHIAGDRAIAAVAGVIRHCARRATDLVFRYGGEEFCVISAGLDAEGARRLAESIIDGVRDLDLEHAAADRGRLTVSIGLAHYEFLGEHDVGKVLQQADTALYRAKQRGRDRLEHEHEHEDEQLADGAERVEGSGG
ncbi:MAG: diguanylate cyclase [Gammaproteobacteria bacterium]